MKTNIFKFDLYKELLYKLNNMSYTQNRKFNYLLENVFQYFHSQIGKIIDTIQTDPSLYTIKHYVTKPKYNSQLQVLYPVKSFYRFKLTIIHCYEKNSKIFF